MPLPRARVVTLNAALGPLDYRVPDGMAVEPGETESFEYTFPDATAPLLAGCHEPGHYEGGMVANITVGE